MNYSIIAFFEYNDPLTPSPGVPGGQKMTH